MDLSYFPYYGKLAQVGEPITSISHHNNLYDFHVVFTRSSLISCPQPFPSAYVREPAGGRSLPPGPAETSQGPVQSGV